jgi:hypothetical protein
MLVWLQTADYQGCASSVQKAEATSAAGDRTWIMRFTVCEQEETVPLICAHQRRGIFSSLLEASHLAFLL